MLLTFAVCAMFASALPTAAAASSKVGGASASDCKRGKRNHGKRNHKKAKPAPPANASSTAPKPPKKGMEF